jgi:hypothetical protein
MKISILLPFLLLSSCLKITCVQADMLFVCMIYGTGVTSRVQKLIEANADKLLQKLKLAEPSYYDIYAPGEVVNTTATRFRELEATDEKDEVADVPGIVPTSRDLQVSSCPSRCSSSGGNYCRSMGCAYCGRCRRRRNLRGDLSLSGTIELTLNIALSLFCIGVPGCKLWTDILIVNDDGTLTSAP